MIDENIQKYAENYTSAESEILRELREKTYADAHRSTRCFRAFIKVVCLQCFLR